ncbi:unnamed protein product, partial [Mycena citricolor]
HGASSRLEMCVGSGWMMVAIGDSRRNPAAQAIEVLARSQTPIVSDWSGDWDRFFVRRVRRQKWSCNC